jgi:hypothetical protein
VSRRPLRTREGEGAEAQNHSHLQTPVSPIYRGQKPSLQLFRRQRRGLNSVSSSFALKAGFCTWGGFPAWPRTVCLTCHLCSLLIQKDLKPCETGRYLLLMVSDLLNQETAGRKINFGSVGVPVNYPQSIARNKLTVL